MNFEKLAQLIYSVAQYEGYNTSLLQTEKNLNSKPENWQFSSESDVYIFEDLLKAITYASKQTHLTVDVFKGINAQMDSKKSGQPERPRVLRQNIEIHVGDFMPAMTVTDAMVARQISAVKGNTKADGWELYARLAKLQAFDNGNKRTALIAANLLTGALTGQSEYYLIVPTDYRKLRFDANLVDYYMADDWDDHMPDETFTLKQFVDFAVSLD